MSKPTPSILRCLGRLRSSSLGRMTVAELEDLRDLAECVQAMACVELARRAPGRAVILNRVSVLDRIEPAVDEVEVAR